MPISCFVLALITVKEHMVADPGDGFHYKSIVALIINKCEVQGWELLRLLAHNRLYTLC